MDEARNTLLKTAELQEGSIMNGGNTEFAPAERAEAENVMRDAASLQTAAIIKHIAYVSPYVLMILNEQRQIVFKNQRLMDLLGTSLDQEILGKRPGELLGCIHAFENDTGCGTTEFCRECGAVKAILKSQREKVGVEEECRIITTTGDAYDFRVWASPYNYDGKDYTIFSLMDISHEKRRFALERTFFHDARNVLSGIQVWSRRLNRSNVPDDIAEPVKLLGLFGNELAAEIDSYMKLLQAEDGQLSLELVNDFSSLELVKELADVCNTMWPNRVIARKEMCDDFSISTDRSLLFRVLFNMIKNGIEASSASEIVSIQCKRDDVRGIFSVHNHGFMPRSTQLQVFQRSFSTKGKGRGIGTYSMKLIGEKYLKGKVWFVTSENEGTTFFIVLPLSCVDA